MDLAQTVALVLLWGLVLLLGWLVYLLMRQHGQVLLDHDQLRHRLAGVERILEGRAEPLHEPTLRPSEPGEAGQATPPAGVLFRTVTLKNGRHFEIAIDARLMDPISQGVASGDSWFVQDYSVLLDLMKPDDAVVDLGGHVGTFSLAAAALGCRVMCIEAAPDNAALLRASAARNGFDRLLVVAAAATDHEGTSQFLPNGPWGTIANAAVSRSPALIYGREHAPVNVPAVTVDGLLRERGWDRVDFLKMDVEGSEMAAVRGMAQLLARSDAPILLYESNGHALHFFGETPDRLAAALREFGYASYQLDSGDLVPLQAGELQAECVINCLAVKGEPPALERWRITAPRSFEDTIQKIVSESRHADEHHRAYLARALAEAEPSLLADTGVATVLRSLGSDPRQAVRAAAAWFRDTSPGAAAHSHAGNVLILTPVKDAAGCLEGYCDRLRRLSYPHRLISLGLLESDSSDTTFQDLQRHLPALRAEFRRADLWKRDFGFHLPPGVPRWAPEIQTKRRSILARSRNHLLLHALDDEDWVVWLDVDVIDYPPDLIERLLASGKDIVQPHCVLDYGGRTFDLNGWRDQGRLHLDDLRGEGELVELDTVGATVLLVRADLHRDGLIYPAFPYGRANPRIRAGRHSEIEGEIESEGLGVMARDLGYQCWGMPHLEVIHNRT
jgi:FkbM family methyltransferase